MGWRRVSATASLGTVLVLAGAGCPRDPPRAVPGANYCGDGKIDSPQEVCDDGPANSDAWASDAHCSADCSAEGPYCGDGKVDSPQEVCDDGPANSDAWALDGHCNASCSAAGPYCGDGKLDSPQEACDDRYNDDCGSCNSRCTAPGTGDVCFDTTSCPELGACAYTNVCAAPTAVFCGFILTGRCCDSGAGEYCATGLGDYGLGACLPNCDPATQDRCGQLCCSHPDVCYLDACQAAGETCSVSADCGPDEYCETGLYEARCLPVPPGANASCTNASGEPAPNAVVDIAFHDLCYPDSYVVAKVRNEGSAMLPAGTPFAVYADEAGTQLVATGGLLQHLYPGESRILRVPVDVHVMGGLFRFNDDGTGARAAFECDGDDASSEYGIVGAVVCI